MEANPDTSRKRSKAKYREALKPSYVSECFRMFTVRYELTLPLTLEA